MPVYCADDGNGAEIIIYAKDGERKFKIANTPVTVNFNSTNKEFYQAYIRIENGQALKSEKLVYQGILDSLNINFYYAWRYDYEEPYLKGERFGKIDSRTGKLLQTLYYNPRSGTGNLRDIEQYDIYRPGLWRDPIKANTFMITDGTGNVIYAESYEKEPAYEVKCLCLIQGKIKPVPLNCQRVLNGLGNASRRIDSYG